VQIVPAMAAYLPVYCSSCAHASLARADEGDQHLSCSFCEGVARVIPGPIYSDGDWLAFADIDKAVFEAELHGEQAAALAAELQDLLNGNEPPTAIVRQMIARVPSLVSARPALVNRLPRGLRMLMTLLIARTRDVPLKSGAYPATSPRSSGKASRG
jgi:hypothetical protein